MIVTGHYSLLCRARCESGIALRDQLLSDSASLGRLDFELHLALLLECGEIEDSLVDSVAHGQETVVLEDGALLARTQSPRYVPTLLSGEDLVDELG